MPAAPCAPLYAFALTLLLAVPALAADGESKTLRLWPGQSPGEQGPVEPEKADPERVTNVSEPTLTIFPAPREKATGVGLIIAPGGAYQFLSWSLEGTEIARWFNNVGVTAFVLKYRVPRRSFDPGSKLPLMDAQRAVSLVRQRAKEWDLDPARIGFLGFSAGGHLGANLAGNSEQRAYEAVDEGDKTSCRPDFTVLIYPGGLLDPKDPARLAPEMHLSRSTPPTFIAVAADDKGCTESSLRYFQALQATAVPSELHVYAGGGHGFGIRPRAGVSATWTDRCADWLRTIKILPSGK
jgi:acetyl esterase/lipase